MRLWKSHICSNKLDGQETNISFSQFNRIRNYLSGHGTEIGWFACSGIVGSNCFCLWKYSHFSDRSGKLVNGKDKSYNKIDVVHDIDSVPSNVQSSRQESSLYVFEDEAESR